MAPRDCLKTEKAKLVTGTMREKGKNMLADKVICKAFDYKFDVQPTANPPSWAFLHAYLYIYI